jgi:bla regulator protein blaR1
MIPYVLNFVLCSGLLLIVYHLFLSSESMYRFNRFYLLFSLVLSLAVPFITIQTSYNIPAIKQAVPFTESVAPYQQPGNTEVMPVTEMSIPVAQTLDYKPYIIGGIYILVALALFIRFARNIYQIYRRRASCYTYEHEGTAILLLQHDVPPHSFLNNIFIAEKDYNIGIDPQIIRHERAHAEQLHSIDIIIVELVQIVCWFNPLIPFYRKAIQLNHEFLADEAVVKNYDDMPEYQHLLLVKATQNNGLNLTSPFNYLTIKKRLIMMTKTTSAKTALFKKLLVLPAVVVTLLLSCDRNTKTSEESKVNEAKQDAKPTAPMKPEQMPIHDKKRLTFSATDAPETTVKEYEALLKKHGLVPVINIKEKQLKAIKAKGHTTVYLDSVSYQQYQSKLHNMSAGDKERLKELFLSMSKSQQDHQYVQFIKGPEPAPKKNVTAAQLQQWQDAKTYQIFIDNKPAENAVLANYKADDFDCMTLGKLSPKAAKKNGFNYLVQLMTKPFYADYYKDKMIDHPIAMIYHASTGIKSGSMWFERL